MRVIADMWENTQVKGAGLLCNREGIVQEVIFNDLLQLPNADCIQLQDIVDQHSRPKFERFLQETDSSGAALFWEINIFRQNFPETMVFFGLSRQEGMLVIISSNIKSTFVLYEELLKIVNEQSRLLRFAQQENQDSQASRNRDLGILEQISQVNNILMNTQRELSKKNYQLQKEQNRFMKLINSNQDAMLVVDQDQNICFANPAAENILGLSSQELQQEKFGSHLSRQEPLELEIPQADGSLLVAELRSTPIDWDQDQAYLVTLRDITARSQAERLREEVQQMTRHDLKTPLNAIIGIPKLLYEDKNLSNDQKEFLRYIEDSGHRMLNMINQSLHMYRMEMGSYELQAQPMDLLALLDRIIQEMQSTLESKNLKLQIKVQGTAVASGSQFFIEAEESLCYTMLGNLLQNALEASPESGIITLDLENDSRKNIIHIHNQGAVPEQIRGNFFEKLVTHGKKQGTGLGTYSARLIARTHGGEIYLQSSATTGTLLSIHLPQNP